MLDTTRRSTYSAAARVIAQRLAMSAQVSGGRATWEIEIADPDSPNIDDPRTILARSDLYQGTSGIGLFLGEYGVYTGDTAFNSLAEAALRHAADDVRYRAVSNIGFYSGVTGVAYACARYGKTSGRDEFTQRAIDLVGQLQLPEEPGAPFDVIGGPAGAIGPLLEIANYTGDARATVLARKCAEYLMAAAVWEPDGVSWGMPYPGNIRHLTGLAHGASGAAYGLLEMYAVTGNTACRYYAEQAFHYERSAYSGVHGNWCDFRDIAIGQRFRNEETRADLVHSIRNGSLKRDSTPHFMVAWCHGASGIGLTRLRAYDILGDDQYLEEATRAAQTTDEYSTANAGASCALCHGLLGNVELVLGVATRSGDAATTEHTLCQIDAAIERHGGSQERWPSGNIHGRPDLSLMLGEAGIGYALLRCIEPSLPSVLLTNGGSSLASTRASSTPSATAGTRLNTPNPPSAGCGFDVSCDAASAGYAHVAAFFSSTVRTFARLGVSCDSLTEARTEGQRVDNASRNFGPVARMHEAIMRICRLAPTTARDQLCDAARVDLERYALAIASFDFLDELLQDIGSPQWEDLDRSIKLQLPTSVSVVLTQWDWHNWATGSAEPARRMQWHLIRRTPRGVSSRPVTRLAGTMLNLLRTPHTPGEIEHSAVDAVQSGAVDSGSASLPVTAVLESIVRKPLQEVRKAVSDQLEVAYRSGLLAVTHTGPGK